MALDEGERLCKAGVGGSSPPVSTSTPTLRVEAALAAKLELDFHVAEQVFPGAAFRRFGPVVATRLPALAGTVPFNKARGYGAKGGPALGDVVAFYADTGQRPSVEVWTEHASDDLDTALRAERLAPGPPTVALHLDLGAAVTGSTAGVDIIEIGRDGPRYFDTLFGGYGVGPEARDLRRMWAIEHETAGLRRYLATVDGRSAAAAALFTRDGAGILAGAATLPRFRGRGCQTALITRRIADASADSDLVVVTAALGSPSHGNLTRLGFQVTHTRTAWS